jgi:hypothetical protein
LEVALWIESKTLGVNGSVEMDGELRNPKKRIIETEENVLGGSIGGPNSDPSGNTEISIEPRIEERSSVDLDPELSRSGGLVVGTRSEAEVG